MIKKNEIIEIKVTGHKYPNIGTADYMGEKIYVKNAIVGQKLKVRVRRRRRCYEGTLVEVLCIAENEITSECNEFNICGGCTYQNIPYDDELKMKKDMVLELFKNADITEFEFLGIEGSPEQKFYRNKMEYSFGDTGLGSEISLGLHKKKSYYEVACPLSCNIADGDFTSILITVLDFFKNSNEKFYHRMRHEGTLRHLVIRKGKRTKEILVNLVTTDEITQNLNELVETLMAISLDGEIAGIVHTINNSLADAVKCDSFEILYGRDYFYEIINGLKFKISAFAFFQTNSLAAESLYKTVKSFIPDENGIIFDLYCGTGTIAQVLSQNAKMVTGIEISEEAVSAAVENAKLNSIENCHFITGDVIEKVTELDGTPDTIIIDPPRDGLNPKLIEKIINFGAQNIVYISCKPTSLLRDLPTFIDSGYRIEKLKMHDLFPRTWHVESIVLMTRK